MNVTYTLHGIVFEWKDDKATANVRKHGIAFETACEVFFDPFFRVEDAGVVEGEAREAVIRTNGELAFVVCRLCDAG